MKSYVRDFWFVSATVLIIVLGIVTIAFVVEQRPSIGRIEDAIRQERVDEGSLALATRGSKDADYRVRGRSIILLSLLSDKGRGQVADGARRRLRDLAATDPDPNLRELAKLKLDVLQ